MNSQLRSLLQSLPSTATQILIFPNDFASNKVSIELSSSRNPRSFSPGCVEESQVSRGALTWRLRGDEVLEPAFNSLSGDTVFLQVRMEDTAIVWTGSNPNTPGRVLAGRH